MKIKRWHLSYVFIYFIMLVISRFESIGIRYSDNKILIYTITYGSYISLLVVWLFSLKMRITQKTMLMIFQIEVAILSFWLVIRYFQKSFFYTDSDIMRISGYFIVLPILLCTFLGILNSLCLGKGSGYSLNKKIYLALIPNIVLILLMLTNDMHNLVFRIPEDKNSLMFIPNYGIILVAVLATIQISVRLAVIVVKTRHTARNKFIKALPFLLGLGMPLATVPYMFNNYVAQNEIIELTLQLYFFEICSWESCIDIGLIPENRQYEKVFQESTIGMRITDANGKTIIASESSEEIAEAVILDMIQNNYSLKRDNFIFNLAPIDDNFVIWQTDISNHINIINKISETKSNLIQETKLLGKELQVKNEQSALKIKNELFNGLIKEVSPHIDLMYSIIENKESSEFDTLLKKLTVIATYIKRRCNLRILQTSNKTIDTNEFLISLNDVLESYHILGIDTSIDYADKAYSAEEIITFFDNMESELETLDFNAKILSVNMNNALTFEFIK